MAPAGASPTAFPEALPVDPCDDVVEAAVARAAAGNLEGAGRLLEEALPRCPDHVGIVRELAAVRFREGRRADAEFLARRLLVLDPDLAWGWDLLGTLRYLDDDAVGALRAWNRIGRPRLDVVEVLGPAGASVAGEPPHGIPSSSVTGLGPGSVVTPGSLVRARRRLESMPAVNRARVTYRPLPGGQVRVEGTITRHSPHSLTRGALPAHLARALGGAARIEASNRAGRGERLVVEGMLDRDYRDARISLAHPVPGGGAPQVEWSLDHRVTVRDDLRTERTGGRAMIFPWPSHRARGAVGVGVDHWPGFGTHGLLKGSASLEFGRILAVHASGSGWTGGFGRSELALETTLDRRTAPRAREEIGGPGPDRLAVGPALRARTSLIALHGVATGDAPHDLEPRFGGSRSSDHVMRASGRIFPPGDAWVHGSMELFHGWGVSTGVIVGGALFVDGVRGFDRDSGSPGDRPGVVHLGTGLRLGIPGADGWLRADWAVAPATGRSRVSVAWVGRGG